MSFEQAFQAPQKERPTKARVSGVESGVREILRGRRAIEAWIEALNEGGNSKTHQLLLEAVEVVYREQFPNKKSEPRMAPTERAKLLSSVAGSVNAERTKRGGDMDAEEIQFFIERCIARGVSNLDKEILQKRVS